eukprot:CAMPEP_0117001898 /NCGR_PEP_ID=MMETSP0472-20121206/3743_1 /TAXON_ID=693140 ORGANISM="Tiarina fusus, Strain LIS" /NCGR_SAMPLE_ID=MMETSP0472 /ASSEMBLY_ACC=CAM_ASM_000603 /LENGTH=35 /DNA_ID= /DNA_START= /DNA_END= /DNA_ORIENTATION=
MAFLSPRDYMATRRKANHDICRITPLLIAPMKIAL